MTRRTPALPCLALALATGCFNPGTDDDTETDPGTGTGMSTGLTETGSTTGTATSGVTTTSAGTTTATTTSDPDTGDVTGSTGQAAECDEPDLPCSAGEYCVAGVCDVPPEGMVAVPAGPFMMGCNEALDTECEDDEHPYHEVWLDAFAIDRNEVSVAEYEACMDANACGAPDTIANYGGDCDYLRYGSDDYPITCVDWYRAEEYCAWEGKRLPTEAEWEKAARGTDGRLYPWGNQTPTCTQDVIGGCNSPNEADPIATKPAGASPYGALGMGGNVSEWVNDWYLASYYVESPAQNPMGPDSGTQRLHRGGNYSYAGYASRASWRTSPYDVEDPEQANPTLGIRCAATPE